MLPVGADTEGPRDGGQTHRLTPRVEMKSQVHDADGELGEGDTPGCARSGWAGGAELGLFTRALGRVPGSALVSLESTWPVLVSLFLPFLVPTPGRPWRVLTSERQVGMHAECQDTCPAAPSCCPGGRPDLNEWQVMPQLHRTLGGAAARGNGVVVFLLWLAFLVTCLTHRGRGQPRAEEAGDGPGQSGACAWAAPRLDLGDAARAELAPTGGTFVRAQRGGLIRDTVRPSGGGRAGQGDTSFGQSAIRLWRKSGSPGGCKTHCVLEVSLPRRG